MNFLFDININYRLFDERLSILVKTSVDFLFVIV